MLLAGVLGFVAERALFRFTLERPMNGFILSIGLGVIGHLDPTDARIAYGVGLLAVILLLPAGVGGGPTEITRRLLARPAGGRRPRAAGRPRSA